MRIKLFLIFTMLGCISCISVTGFYTFNGYNNIIELEVKKDNNFKSYIYLNGSSDTLYGRWKLKNDSLILSVENPDVIFYGNIDYKIHEGNIGSEDSLYFNIKVKNHDSETLIALTINEKHDNPHYIVENNDTVSYYKIDLNQISIGSFTGGYFSYKPKNALSNFFRVELESQNIIERMVIINPDTLYLKKGRKLILADYPEIVLRKNIFR